MYQRYVLTEYPRASVGTRRIYDEYCSVTGVSELPVWLTSMGHNSKLARAYWEKIKGCLLEGELPPLLKAMVLYVVARESGATYCEGWHAHDVLQLDHRLQYADLVTVLDPHGRMLLATAYRAAIDFAARTAWDATSVDDGAFEALAAEGFSRDDIQELLGVIDMSLMFNCYTSALRLPLDPKYQAVVGA